MRKTATIGLAVLLLLLLAPSGIAAPAVPTGTLTMSSSSRLVAGSGVTMGVPVTLDATYAGVRKVDTVRVQILCMQDVGVVYGDNAVLSGSPSSTSFVLGQPTANGTSVWVGGAASCRSDLYVVGSGGRVTFLAAVAFDAA